jgi:hypothetical protein
MWPVIYDGLVSGQERDPLECFPFDMLAPLIRLYHAQPQARWRGAHPGANSSRVDATCLLQLTDGPQLPVAFPGHAADRWALGTVDLILDSSPRAPRGSFSL